jgi:hypothetical protein
MIGCIRDGFNVEFSRKGDGDRTIIGPGCGKKSGRGGTPAILGEAKNLLFSWGDTDPSLRSG